MQLRFPWEADRPAPAAAPAPSPESAPTKQRGRRVALAAGLAAEPGWRFHHLTVSGPASDLAAFAGAARGSGVTPGQLDLAAIV